MPRRFAPPPAKRSLARRHLFSEEKRRKIESLGAPVRMLDAIGFHHSRAAEEKAAFPAIQHPRLPSLVVKDPPGRAPGPGRVRISAGSSIPSKADKGACHSHDPAQLGFVMPATPTPLVEISRLTKSFRQVRAVDRLELKVHEGEVVALLGANGSGKSTTFRMLLNIYRPTSGEARLLGRPSDSLDGADYDRIGFVSESQKLPAWMTVEGFLDYIGAFYSQWDPGLCRSLVEQFVLPPAQRIKHLSRGQKMKVAVASVLPARPRILFLDEPFSGLDVETRAQLALILRSLAKESGLATVLTTHDVEEVEPVATRLAILSRGELKIDEPLRAYLERHRLVVPDGLGIETLRDRFPAEIKLLPPASGLGPAFTESFTPGLRERLEGAVEPPASLRFEPMTLRQILSAHALPLS